MRRFLVVSFLGALVPFLIFGATAVHAQVNTGTAGTAYQLCIQNGNTDAQCQAASGAYTSAAAATTQTPTGNAGTAYQLCIQNGNTDAQCQAAAGAYTAADAAAAKTQTDLSKSTDDQYNWLMIKIMSLFAWLVGVAALTLDYSVYYTVVSMGTFVHNLSAVGVTWRILRDIGNIMLIFGFLAIGFTTILNVNWYGSGKKMLPMLLVAAVFLNFSLFISEAIIDAGNLFATEFFTQINGGSLPTANSLSNTTASQEGISNKIMSQLGLQTIYGNALSANTAIFQGANPWFIGFMGILLFLVTAFVMFSLAFILIARFVALIFLIILAPVGFAGLAVPMLAKRAGQWWSKLLEQTITAPILLLMLYIALTVITDAHFLTGFGMTGAGGADAATGFVENANLAGFAGFMLSFLVAMGLLIAVTIQAKNLSAFGAGVATKTAGALTFGATAMAGRSTVGWASQRASEGWKRMGFSRAPVLGRAVSGVLDRGAKATFDIRSTGALKNLPGGGIDAGTAAKGGYREWEKGKIKEREEYAKTLQQTTGKFLGIRYGVGEEGKQKMWEGRTDEQKKVHAQEIATLEEEQAAERQPLDEERKTQLAKVAELRTKANTTNSDVDRKELADAELTLSNQTKEVEQLRAKHQESRKKLESHQQETLTNIEGKVTELKKAPQEGYAAGITSGPGALFKRNIKAAESIRKEAKKSKTDKEFDVIKKVIESAAKEEKGGEKKEAESKPKPAEGEHH